MALASAATGPIRSIVLDSRVVVTVPIATNRVTTLSFPKPISAIDAHGVSLDSKGLFLMAHTRGSSFLSLRALAPKAAGNLNVRVQGVTYVFELTESSTPVLALNLLPQGPVALPAPALGATGLLALLDTAKAFPLLQGQHPEVVSKIHYRPATGRTDFGDFVIQLQEVLRFDAEDSLVLRAFITNRGDAPLHYAPQSFQVRAGDRLYPQSISEASGVVPPGGSEPIYVAITGSPDGGRADLSIRNEFSVLVTRLSPRPVVSPDPAQPAPVPGSASPTASPTSQPQGPWLLSVPTSPPWPESLP